VKNASEFYITLFDYERKRVVAVLPLISVSIFMIARVLTFESVIYSHLPRYH